MKSSMTKVTQIAAVSSTLLLTAGGIARADNHLWRGTAYRAHYGEQGAVIVRRGALNQSRYYDPATDFAYAPSGGTYVGSGDYQCQLSPSSIDYVPCNQY